MRMEKLFMVKLAKLMNYISCILIIVSIILRFIDFGESSSPFFYLLTFYLIAFGALLLLSELRVRKVIAQVMFLNSRMGKGMFLVFIGLLLFDEERKSDMGISICLVLIGFFNIMISCMRKDYPKEDEDLDSSITTEEIDEDEDYEMEEEYEEKPKKKG